jgi:hypothetical protein
LRWFFQSIAKCSVKHHTKVASNILAIIFRKRGSNVLQAGNQLIHLGDRGHAILLLFAYVQQISSQEMRRKRINGKKLQL